LTKGLGLYKMELMRDLFSRLYYLINLFLVPAVPLFFKVAPVRAVPLEPGSGVDSDISSEVEVREETLGFNIPSFGDILTFIVRLFFVIAGIFALIYLLLGAFSWITSGGDKDKVEKARDKIQAALIGVILIIIVVAIVATLEQVVFQHRLCFGLTCPLSIPELLEAPEP